MKSPKHRFGRAVKITCAIVLVISLAGTPALAVTVTKTATPTTVPSGGQVTFTIKVSDCGATFVGFCLITSIADDKHAPTLLECVTPAFFGGVFGDYECTYERTVTHPGPYPVPVTNTTTVSGTEFIGGTLVFSVTDTATVDVTVGPPGPTPSTPSSSVEPLVGGLPSLGSIGGHIEGDVRRLTKIRVDTGVSGDDIDRDVNNQLRNGPDADEIAADVHNQVS